LDFVTGALGRSIDEAGDSCGHGPLLGRHLDGAAEGSADRCLRCGRRRLSHLSDPVSDRYTEGTNDREKRRWGRTLSSAVPDRALIEPPAQASLLRFTTAKVQDRNRLLFANPASTARERLTVRLSYDEGATWPIARIIHDGPAAYSSLVVSPEPIQTDAFPVQHAPPTEVPLIHG
jgi:hypothetical protein